MFGPSCALALELQGTNADQFAAARNQAGAAPVRMRGIGEDRLIQQIFPIPGELLLGDDLACDRAGASAGAAHHDLVADSCGTGRAQRHRSELERTERLYEPK